MQLKKVILSIFVIGLLTIGGVNAFVVNFHYNGNIKSYVVDNGAISVYLSGDYTKSGNTYILNHDFNNVKVYYKDVNGNSKTLNAINDLYVNGKSSISYTGNGYLVLNQSPCNSSITIPTESLQFTGSSNLGTGNIFKNFIENGFAVISTNIPSFITFAFYMLVILILFSLVKRLRGKK